MAEPDPLYTEVARIVLAVAEQHGFALGGGLALVVHGVVDRPTEDVDAFTDIESGVAAAAEVVPAALEAAGFTVIPVVDDAESALVSDLDQHVLEWELHRGGRVVRLTLACQSRLRRPVAMDLGPVVDLTDLLAWKVVALVDRARERDYVDVAAVLDTYRPADLLAMARRADPGMADEDVPLVGRRLDRLPDEAFLPYQPDRSAIALIRRRFAAWPR
ncbi:nucleotidyl transferase AbiEii/AbiGii toxin family protein [Solwaraspora sp. WMMD1047]|uniref:nucleotidyl transferase AbiEii/AbiGii toxin family protein n=1 Tax=Solwaraspora sp. WMMD1047 TaxID=3016102 RepID=UPI002417A466|nr:nucleotidyl transferase AbiEii/AbiGii toxin family protein [Solwaraspora sp. WMMD1047]MDG4830917.1 nucleotidyl transferase AbiEii/AbiGii toxin family protein [Solwaraspora sp. WMMD1047]